MCLCEINSCLCFSLLFCHRSKGLDEEAIVDHGKTSFTTHTNYEREDLESMFKATQTEIIFLCFSE